MTNNSDEYCTLYIVRHGETEWNALGRVQGQTDIDLNINGENQAKTLGEKLKDIEFAAAFSSDLLRAKRTAEIVVLERNLLIQTTKLLRERNFGQYEGKLIADLREVDISLSKLTDKERFSTKIFPDVENDEDIITRFITFIREVCVAYLGKDVLIATHGGVMGTLLIHLGFTNYREKDAGQVKISNASYIKLKSDGVDFFIEEMQGIERLD